jgi:predicted ester cyclase
MSSTASENKATVLRYFLESHNPPYRLEVIDETSTPEHAESLKRWMRMELAAFPDIRCTVDDVIAEGDKVVLRITFQGTHLGEFRTPLGTIPATGRRIRMGSTTIYRLVDGRVAEEWPQHDWLGLLQQFGTLPMSLEHADTQ